MTCPRAAVGCALSAVLAGAALAGGPVSATDPCATSGRPAFGDVETTGAIDADDLGELSGLAASRTVPGVLWAHNDSGARPRLVALDATGAVLADIAVRGADAVDWEDIAVGPTSDGRSAIYIGDIGDNLGQRTDGVSVYRVVEPAGPIDDDTRLGRAESITLVYPDVPRDAEALLVDPLSGDLLIVTKDLLGASRVYVAAAADLVDDATITLTDAGAVTIDPNDGGEGLPATMVTAGDISPDGRLVLLRTYQTVLVYLRAVDQSVAEALRGPACLAPAALEPQGEALAVLADGSGYVTASEMQRARDDGAVAADADGLLSTVDIEPPAATVTTTTVTTTTVTTTTGPTVTTTTGLTTTGTTTTGPTTSDPSSTDGAPSDGASDDGVDASTATVLAVAGAALAALLVVPAVWMVVQRRRRAPD